VHINGQRANSFARECYLVKNQLGVRPIGN
jgi:hypothetical protein